MGKVKDAGLTPSAILSHNHNEQFVRANRLAHAQRRVAMMLGGQAGSRLLTHLYMPTSHDTRLRLIRKW